jgi:hypothetical protein
MASGFPGSIDNFTDPLTTSALNSPSHAGQHQDLNDAVEKIETYMGLVKVIPTSGTNCTVGATGTVTIGNAVTTFTVNGAFSSLYENYRIIINGGSATNASGLSLALGASTTGYYQILSYGTYATGALTTLAVNNGVSWSYAGEVSTNSIALNIDLLGPNTAKFTHIMGFYPGTVGGWQSGYHGVATAYTGFTITSGHAMTGGTLRVYGYRN